MTDIIITRTPSQYGRLEDKHFDFLRASSRKEAPMTTNISIFYRKSEPILIPIPALARLTDAEAQKYGITEILCDASPTEAIILELGTVLLAKESHINRATYDARIKGLCLPGFLQALWFIENQNDEPIVRLKTLFRDENLCGDFRGFTGRRGRSTGPRFLHLFEVGGRLVLGWDSTGGLARFGRLAVCSMQ